MLWVQAQEVPVPPGLEQGVGGHPLVAQTLVRRGLADPLQAQAFLDPQAYQPADPYDLPGMAQAVELLARAIRRQQHILVWGDFDVDGQTSTALLVSILQDLGVQPSFHIPLRETESHGVNLPVLRQLLAQGVQLVLTCDTGIAAHEALAYAAQQGVTVVVTDHHDLPPQLPQAGALVNPKLLPQGERHPFYGLPGVGVAFQLAKALYAHFGRAGEEDRQLDLVALGIVADVAWQTGDTRYLLQRGLAVLQRTPRLGLQALFENARINTAFLSEEEIGFLIGPRLNALGRLGDANQAVEFLTTQDLSQARILAQILEGLNGQRKLLSKSVFAGVMAQLDADPALLNSPVLLLHHPSWPAGVIGIVASRLVERYGKPAILISAPPGQPGRASARSVAGLNITAAIAANQEHLLGFGGHPMAAGFAIAPENIPAFRRALARSVESLGAPPAPTLEIDGELSLADLSLELAADLDRLAPYGPGNQALTLVCRDLRLVSQASLGREDEHLVMVVEDAAGERRRILWWGGSGWPVPEGRFDLALRLRATAFRGERELQLEWVDFQPLEEQAPAAPPPRRVVPGIDLRQVEHPLSHLEKVLAGYDPAQVLVWAEGPQLERLKARGLPAAGRHELHPVQCLVIWTPPAGPAEFQAALARCQAAEVLVFAADPQLGGLPEFLQRLAGMARWANGQPAGSVSLARMASALAQRSRTVTTGLEWLAASGHYRFELLEGELVSLAPGGPADAVLAAQLQNRLQGMLAETAAYRAYFARAALETLLQVENPPPRKK